MSKNENTRKKVVKKRKKDKWREYEEEACNFLNMKHVGGPGSVDCQDKNDSTVVAEVKCYNRTFNIRDLKNILENKKYKTKNHIKILVCGNVSKNVEIMAIKNPDITLISNFEEKIKKIRQKEKFWDISKNIS
ncbi:MAG: hypothetical protein ACFFDN_51165 [Candidatus Hodarchaeota archaeon]